MAPAVRRGQGPPRASRERNWDLRVRTRRRGGGFWKGVVMGFLVALAAALALALANPPVRYLPPDLPAGVAAAPSA